MPARAARNRPRRIPHPLPVIDTARMAELRAAQVEDVSGIVAIDPDSLGRPGEIRALVQEQASLVAVERGEIVGFLALRPAHFYQRDFVDLLFVAPRWRRQGVGRSLLQAGLQNASTSRVFVSTNESNTPMRQLLRGEGWSPSGVLTGLDEGDPEHVFFHDVPPG
jgi:GNAT superfamily N-acetyltransferase